MLGAERPGLDLLGDLAARQGVRARVDDRDRRLHEADLHPLRARARRASCARAGSPARSTSPTARRRCCRGRRRSRSRSGSCSRARPRARCRAPHSARRWASGNLICCDVGGTSTDISLVVDGQPFVNNTFELEHDLIINALSTEISSVGAGGGSIVSISPSGDVLRRARQRRLGPRPGLLRPRRHAADDDRRLPADGDPRSRRLRRRRAARSTPSSRARAFESLETNLALDERIAFAYRHRRHQHRRGGRERRDPPRRRSARLQRSSPTAPPARCCCRRRSS